MKRRLVLLALPALLTVCLAAPAYAEGDDGVDINTEQITGLAPDIQTVVDFAYRQLGKPYVHGATGPNAFDCSGLTSKAYEQIGIDLPAYSYTQARMGRRVSTDDIQAGDLLFTNGLGHVTIDVSSTE